VAHLERRFPGLVAWPPPADEPLLALATRHLVDRLEAGGALRLPGLAVAAGELPAFAAAERGRLAALAGEAGPAAAARLAPALARLGAAVAR